MTYLISSHIPLAPDTRKRPPQSGFVQTGLGDINVDLPEADFWPGITSVLPVIKTNKHYRGRSIKKRFSGIGKGRNSSNQVCGTLVCWELAFADMPACEKAGDIYPDPLWQVRGLLAVAKLSRKKPRLKGSMSCELCDE